MWYNFVVVTLLVALGGLHRGDGARILGIFPTPSISHQVVFRALTLELNKRGHELVVVTTDPVNDATLKNYTEIDTSFLYDEKIDMDFVSLRGSMNSLSWIMEVSHIHHMVTEMILNQPRLRELYAPDSNQKFDLILLEMFFQPAFLALAKRFDAPIIGIMSLGLSAYQQYEVGNPILTSHPSVWELRSPDTEPLSIWQRLDNFIRLWRYIYFFRTDFMQKQDAIARKYFGNDLPSLYDLEKNVSLIFENQQTPISFIRPSVPKVVQIGGIHVSSQIKTLTKVLTHVTDFIKHSTLDLQVILDEATQGFVYMSLGSNMKSSMLSKEARAEFMAAFAQMPYLVVWKFEDDFLPGKPDNVVIMKWTPQRAILAHPNLKAFIYQGGLQSTEEAITHGVPLVGLPVFGDQDMQVNKMVSLGVARKLEITSVNRDDLVEAVQTVALDSSYKERMLNLRSLMRDNEQNPMKTAIWWTEFVIRHKGAPHLQSSTAEEPWYRRQDMDIVALISAAVVIVSILALALLYLLVKTIHSCAKVSHPTKRKIN